MKDRITMGFDADVAETAALTIADEQATERIFAACDWEHDRNREKNRIDSRLRRLKEGDRAFARAVLMGKTQSELNIPRSTFSDKMKKIEKTLRDR